MNLGEATGDVGKVIGVEGVTFLTEKKHFGAWRMEEPPRKELKPRLVTMREVGACVGKKSGRQLTLFGRKGGKWRLKPCGGAGERAVSERGRWCGRDFIGMPPRPVSKKIK